MKNKKSSRISLTIREAEKSIELSLEKAGRQLLVFEDVNRRAPRVVGYNKQRITEQQLLSFIEREKVFEPKLTEVAILRNYISGRDKEIDVRIFEIQKSLRYLIIAIESKQVAEQVMAHSIAALKAVGCGSILPKFPSPRGKCTKCNAFYREVPDDFLCKYCDGTVKNELRPNTWFECQVCQASGYDSRFKKPCSSCDQKGWLFIEAFKP